MHRTDEHDVADAVGHEVQPSEDERPDKQVAQFAVRLYERQQLVAADFDHFSRFGGADGDQCLTTRQRGDFAAELAGSKVDQEFLAGRGLPNGLEAARGDDEELYGRLSRSEKHLAGVDLSDLSMRCHASHLRRGPRRACYPTASGIHGIKPSALREQYSSTSSPPRARRISRPPICEVETRPISGRLLFIEGSYESLWAPEARRCTGPMDRFQKGWPNHSCGFSSFLPSVRQGQRRASRVGDMTSVSPTLRPTYPPALPIAAPVRQSIVLGVSGQYCYFETNVAHTSTRADRLESVRRLIPPADRNDERRPC